MKMKILYQCDYCLTEYNTSSEAYKCEADCLKLTLDEYDEYKKLLKEEKEAFGQASCTMNNEVRERCDNAVKAVVEFQKKHGITDSKW